MTPQLIADIRSMYYEELYKERPMVKVRGDVKFDWAWEIMEKVLKQGPCKT